MTASSPLQSPVDLAGLQLSNRVVMASMTRLRAFGDVPSALMATYYGQRAAAGLIVTEASTISDSSATYDGAPGIYADTFVEPWSAVCDAVHAAGGHIFLQLWHSGRVSHTSLQRDGKPPFAPSSVAGEGTLMTPLGLRAMSIPESLPLLHVQGLVRAFAKAARRAHAAGFDGVEIHAAYGYLVDQFLQDGSNRRADIFGGSIANRARFLFDIVAAAQETFGPRVGIKLSPLSSLHGMADSDPVGTFGYVLERLDRVGVAYVHIVRSPKQRRVAPLAITNAVTFARQHFRGKIIANGSYDREQADAALLTGSADLVSFARPFIANPDLPRMFEAGVPIRAADPMAIYPRAGEPLEMGYTEYAAQA